MSIDIVLSALIVYLFGCSVSSVVTQHRMRTRKQEIDDHPFITEEAMRDSIRIATLLSWIGVGIYLWSWAAPRLARRKKEKP